MNAYKLADEYEYTKKEHDAFVENPTDANRIAVLCKRDEFLQKLIRQQADRIAELEKQLKPVGNGTIGYLDDVPINDLVHRKSLPLPLPINTWTACAVCGQRVTGDSIHTCSPQTKPLSDEEIKQIWYDLYPLSSSSYWDDKREGLAELKFARAIESKVRGQ